METEPKKTSVLEISEEIREEISALFEGREWKGEKIPPIYLKFFSGPHGTGLDAKNIKEQLSEADIYIPEYFAWDDELSDSLNEISFGKTEPFSDRKEKYGFFSELTREIANSRKPIAFIDFPYDEIDKRREEFITENKTSNIIARLPYDEAIKVFLQTEEETVNSVIVERERYMLSVLPETIRRVLLKHPELRQKDVLRILITLGEDHSAIYHVLKSIGGKNVSREFRYGNPVSVNNGELGKNYLYGKESGDTLKQWAFLESLILNSEIVDKIFEVCQHTEKNSVFARFLCHLFESEDIKNIFNEWKLCRAKGNINFFSLFKNHVKEKGVEFPKTEEELDAIIAKTPYMKYQKTLEEIKKKKTTQ